MSIGFAHRLGLFLCGIVWQGLLSAAVVTVDFKATISAVNSTSPANSIAANISAGDQFNGTYTYDTAVQDSQNVVTIGSFENALTELYINITNKPYYWHLGKYAGNFTGLVETENVTAADRLRISSTESAVVAGSPLILDAAPLSPQPLKYFQLQFTSPDFLTNDAMPLLPPPTSTTASICLRFDATSVLTTLCGFGASDIVIDFTFIKLERVNRYAWANPLPQGSTLQDVVWNSAQQMYIAVGQNGTIITSSNGIGWVNRQVLTNESLVSITRGNEIFVAVSKFTLFSSKDSVVWQETSVTPVGTNWEYSDVIWDGVKFVVVGKHFPTDVLVNTSPDGIVWTPDYPAGKRLSDVATNGTLYVGIAPLVDNQILTSLDLKTWKVATTQPLKTVYDVLWNGTIFIAVGASGTIVTSDNGQDWVERISGTTTLLNGVSWHNNQFVVVGDEGLILTGTPDGVNWSSQIVGNTKFKATAFDGANYVVVGDNGKILRSDTTLNWKASSSGSVENFNDTIWTGSEFVAVGNNGSVGTSLNGIDWVFQSSLGLANLKGVATNATIDTNGVGTHVTVGANGTVYRSLDPKLNWTLVRGDSPPNSTLDDLNQVSWMKNKFIAVGAKGIILTSPDGDQWTLQAPNISSNNIELTDLVANNGIIIAVGKNVLTNRAVVITSTDGISWLAQQSSEITAMTGLSSITWSGNEFVASGGSYVANDLFSSRDGLTWRAYKNFGSITGVEHLRWVGNKFIGVGSRLGRNEVFSSPDGLTWNVEPAYFSGEQNYGIAKSADNLIIVGKRGAINYKTGSYINNFAPYAYTGEDQFVVPGEAITITATVSDSDGPDPIINVFEQTSGPAITDTNPNPLIIEFVASTVADYSFMLTVTDDRAVVSTDEVLIKVAPNQAPTAVDAGVDQDVFSDSIVTMTGSGQDPENRGLSFSWLQVDNLQGTIDFRVTLVDADKAEARFRAPATATVLNLSFELTVSDNAGLSTTDVVNITVRPKPAPAAKPADSKKGGGAFFWLLPILVLAARRAIFDSR